LKYEIKTNVTAVVDCRMEYHEVVIYRFLWQSNTTRHQRAIVAMETPLCMYGSVYKQGRHTLLSTYPRIQKTVVV